MSATAIRRAARGGCGQGQRVSQAMCGHFAAARSSLSASWLSSGEPREPDRHGEEITADHFAGQFVDIAGTSISKGFAGAMKRHNFGGLRASRRVDHRSHGRPAKARSRAGRSRARRWLATGSVRVTTQNLQVVHWDAERGLIMVKGAVPDEGRLGHDQGRGQGATPDNVILPARCARRRQRRQAARRPRSGGGQAALRAQQEAEQAAIDAAAEAEARRPR